ncbi:VOC family protein [Actinopolyspora saharensis]|uniref:Glyoxalase/Bleomycin resistance-like N-terminal domain-containing protein n=1 Tax=Actinopolyspora saharensis TaxID=995062 RepID=A0A1H1DBK1_9ACTN|nr:glyoxalase/bleomycin resistance/extradiol dioxygenase family protein [Actinopolyspora saharensis]SDQ73802.1 hypothetical protein SAMN04489718_1998 [Actinopolyspora saharensis]
MSTKLFLNLPVQDLNRSVGFFERLGFSFDQNFTDESATCMIVGDGVFVMLLTEPFFGTFTRKSVADANSTTEVITCLGLESRQRVDELVDEAFAAGAGAANEVMDEGFMYLRSFQDLDGHIWEVAWMDPEQAAPGRG